MSNDKFIYRTMIRIGLMTLRRSIMSVSQYQLLRRNYSNNVLQLKKLSNLESFYTETNDKCESV